MIDEQFDTAFESLLTATLNEMIPKAHSAAGSLPAEFPARDLESEPARFVDVARAVQGRPRSRRYVGIAATILAAASIAGIVVARDRNNDDAPAASNPSTVPVPVPDLTPTGPLLSAHLPVEQAPLVVVDSPGWAITYLTGTDDLSAGDLNVNTLGLVGPGPRYDAPMFFAWTTPDGGMDLSGDGTFISIAGSDGRVSVQPHEPGSSAAATNEMPILYLTWPLSDGRLAHANAMRFNQDDAVSLAGAVSFAGTSPDIVVPAGFTRIDSPPPAQWLQFENQYTNGAKSIQLNGSNLAATGLVMNGGELRSNRSVGGTDVAFYSLDGRFSALWLDNGWTFKVDGTGFASEDEFLSVLPRLQMVDRTTFATAAAALDPLLPGDQLSRVQELETGIELPANTPTVEWSPSRIATTERDFDFRFYLGLGCGWSRSWARADEAGDQAGKDAAAAGVESLVAKLTTIQFYDVGSYSQLATQMRTDVQDQVLGFGSNDCPTWSINMG